MDSYFQYYKTATGKHFIGRGNDVNILGNLLSQGENVVIYEPPKTGKRSLIQQCILRMRSTGKRFLLAELDLVSIRSWKDLALALGDAVLYSVSGEASTLRRLVEEHLSGSHFAFDAEGYDRRSGVLMLTDELDEKDLKAILSLPYRLGSSDSKLFVIIHEFQNVLQTEDGEKFCMIFENLLKSMTKDERSGAAYLFSGSQVNAMKFIFEHRRFFFRQVERVPLSPIDTKDIIDYVLKGYLANGKVIQRELILGSCELLKHNIYYILHLNAISDSLTRGYINETLLSDALNAIIAINEPAFLASMYDLTGFQIQLLRAIVDGNLKFSSADVIRHYGFNSSANVKRLKDALAKKELVTFDENDEPHILDPLFEYWVKSVYFKIKQ